jgi:hypothetical protein
MANTNSYPSAVLLDLESENTIIYDCSYVLPPFGILGSQIANLYPFDSELFCSAWRLLLESVMLLPFNTALNVKLISEE